MNIFGDIVHWFSGITGDLTKPITDFIQSLAGQIAAGLESGLIAILGDVWKVLVGPLELIAGALIAVIAFGLLFRNDVVGAIAP